MPDSDALRISVQADIGPLKAAMAEAAGSVESASARMAASLKEQGLTATEISQALNSVGLSAKGLVPASEAATTGMSNFRGAMGAARVEMGALEGSTGMMAGGLARVAAQSQALAPIIQAAFPVFAGVALIDVVGTIGEKVYKAAENFIFLQDQEDALTAITDKLRASEISLTDSISKSYVELAKLTEGPLAATRTALDAMQNRPIKLPFDDKELKKYPDDIQQFVKGFQSITGADIAGSLDTINAKIKQQQAQLEMVNSDIAEGGEMGFVAYGREAEQLEKNIRLLQQLGQAVVDQESKLRAETAVTAAEGAKQEQEAEDRAARQADRIARENTAAAVRLQEELKKVKLPTSDEDLIAAMGQAMPKMAAEWQKGLDNILNAEVKNETAIDVAITKGTNERIAMMAKADAKIREEGKKAADELTADWTKAFTGINSSIERMTREVLTGTQTIGQAFLKMGSGMLQSVVGSLEQMVLKYAEHFLIVDVLEKSAMANRLITWATGNATKLAAEKAAAAGEIATDAGLGAAASYASVLEALPFPVNVATAPGVAASQASAIEGVGAIAAFEKGGIVPMTGLAMVHQGEKILPKSASGTGASGGSPIHVHIHAADAKSFTDMINRNADAFSRLIQKAMRNGKLQVA